MLLRFILIVEHGWDLDGTDSKSFSKSLHYALTAAPLLDNGGLASSWLVVGEGVSHNDEWGIWGGQGPGNFRSSVIADSDSGGRKARFGCLL